MFASLRNAHRFLADHLFYPLALSSALAWGYYILRVFISRNVWIYLNLPWNLLLAWLPYLFSLWAVWLEQRHPGQWLRWLAPAGLWLAFFPNAPYILTDFFHLEARPYLPLWFDIGLLAAFAWTGFFLGIVSLRLMHILVERYVGVIFGWLFALIALGLSGLGLYLGRFSRWNSWDLLTQPDEILKEVILRLTDPINNRSFYGFTVMFTSLLLVSYLVFISVQRLRLPSKKGNQNSGV
jgi:uncharacterized membrane protein